MENTETASDKLSSQRESKWCVTVLHYQHVGLLLAYCNNMWYRKQYPMFLLPYLLFSTDMSVGLVEVPVISDWKNSEQPEVILDMKVKLQLRYVLLLL